MKRVGGCCLTLAIFSYTVARNSYISIWGTGDKAVVFVNRMVVGFKTTYAISTYHNWSYEL